MPTLKKINQKIGTKYKRWKQVEDVLKAANVLFDHAHLPDCDLLKPYISPDGKFAIPRNCDCKKEKATHDADTQEYAMSEQGNAGPARGRGNRRSHLYRHLQERRTHCRRSLRPEDVLPPQHPERSGQPDPGRTPRLGRLAVRVVTEDASGQSDAARSAFSVAAPGRELHQSSMEKPQPVP